MTTLSTYLKNRQISYAEAARQMDVCHATVVRRWALPAKNIYRVIPSGRNMVKIMDWTDCQVMPNDFFDSLDIGRNGRSSSINTLRQDPQ